MMQLCPFQLRVTARDLGVPPKSSMVDVQINVRRNNFNPVFTQSLYQVNISELLPYGTSILTVTATDEDSVLQKDVRCFNIVLVVHLAQSIQHPSLVVH